MNSIIIDDDEGCRTILAQFIGQIDNLKHIGSYKNGKEAINALRHNDTHLVFLDVEMPEISGIDLLAKLDIKPFVILTTSHKEYALDSYEYEIVDYLVKPVTFPRFLKAVSKAEKRFESLFSESISNDRDYFFIKKDAIINKISINDVLWIGALGDYVTINTKSKKFIIHSTLGGIENSLPKDKFMRVHRSYIIQMENIKAIEGSTIYIENTPIPLGMGYKDNFIKRLGVLG